MVAEGECLTGSWSAASYAVERIVIMRICVSNIAYD